jgi:hypothetical protein
MAFLPGSASGDSRLTSVNVLVPITAVEVVPPVDFMSLRPTGDSIPVSSSKRKRKVVIKMAAGETAGIKGYV